MTDGPPGDRSQGAPEAGAERAFPPPEEERPDEFCSRKVYDELYDRWVRLQAEFDNFRKRTDREKAEWRVLATERLLTDVLPVVDNLELALRHVGEGEGGASLAEGVGLVLRQLEGVLARHGLTPVEALGKPFDPRFHEAVAREESDAAEDGAVVGELQRGWLLGNRLLRPSRVVVNHRPSPQAEEAPA